MKKAPLSLTAAAVWLLCAAYPQAQTDQAAFDPLGEHLDLPKLVRVQLEFIEVSHELLTELLFAPSATTNDTALRGKLAELAKQGKATVVETMLVTCRSGQKATTESIKEFIYPTEYEPPEMPLEVHTKPNGEKTTIASAENAVGPTPTAFETRNLGSTLEVEPTLGNDDRIVDLRLCPEIVYHVGNTVWAEWKDQRGEAHVQMPMMYTARLNTSVVLLAGQPLMVGALSPKGPDGFPDFSRKLMVFARCEVLTAGR